MQIPGWIYYNHAAIPTCPPHETPDLSPINNGDIWKLTNEDGGGKPLLAWWTTDFDTSEETAYWYVIKRKPFSLDELSRKYRHNVKQALDRCNVKWINAIDYSKDLWSVYEAAFEKYEGAINKMSYAAFEEELKDKRYEWCAAFSHESGEMIGWMKCYDLGECVETMISKYNPQYVSLRPSDAIHYHVLNHYLNELGRSYVSSGSRNISHKTNVQDYKIHNWQFRKAYCKMHLKYSPRIAWVVKILFPFRKMLEKLDFIKIVHAINGVLKMEEIARQCRE